MNEKSQVIQLEPTCGYLKNQGGQNLKSKRENENSIDKKTTTTNPETIRIYELRCPQFH